MLEWVKNIMNSLGYPGVVLLMFVENIFPPIPSELVMPLASFTAAQGELSLVGVVIAGTLGSVIGALPLYYLGRSVGEQRLASWADKYGKWVAFSAGDIRMAKDWFDRHGSKTVFFGRLVPGVRSLISIPAGLARMHILQFLLYSALGAGIWTGMLAYIGYLLGENYQQVNKYLGPATFIVLGLLLVRFSVWVWRRKQQQSST